MHDIRATRTGDMATCYLYLEVIEVLCVWLYIVELSRFIVCLFKMLSHLLVGSLKIVSFDCCRS